ncbi:peroxiredoxin-like family protein [Agaribacter flavus]|uniref:thioredoxin-dependent peroxiredoxin n=1 Tax=Agaribacter flavus TaxID=1902781 RepID=A0ABV7FQ16_9ALTE
MTLGKQLNEVKEASAQNIPADKLEVMLAETETLKAAALEENAPKTGDTFPHFLLTDQLGKSVSLAEIIKTGPVVITFYRGGWCPYCNLELRAYQSILEDISAQGARLVAITPELPDASLSTAEKNELKFSVLSDPKSEFSKKLGIVFSLPESLRPIYKGFGIDVESHNGEGVFELPLAATFVIAENGKVAFADVNADYTYRTEPSKVLEVLAQLK